MMIIRIMILLLIMWTGLPPCNDDDDGVADDEFVHSYFNSHSTHLDISRGSPPIATNHTTPTPSWKKWKISTQNFQRPLSWDFWTTTTQRLRVLDVQVLRPAAHNWSSQLRVFVQVFLWRLLSSLPRSKSSTHIQLCQGSNISINIDKVNFLFLILAKWLTDNVTINDNLNV